MATVVRQHHKPQKVKNLNWLLRHAHDILEIQILALPVMPHGMDAYMIVHLCDDIGFYTFWASRFACRQWLRERRALRGVPLVWFDQLTTCDNLA